MAIRGSLREASFPDVLQLLAMGKKTGCLSVTNRQQFGTVYFDRGRICQASIVNRRDRLGDILVKHGLVTPAALDAAIAEQSRQPDQRLGDLLVAAGNLRREQLNEYLRHQIEEAVYFLFTWSQGTFTFEPDVRPDQRDHTVSISPESLLLEGARRVDEWSLIEKKVPSFDLIFALDRDHLAESSVEVTAEQETIILLIDGRRDVTAIVEESGLDEFEVGKAIFGLATAGFLHRLGRSQPREAVGAEAKTAEHRNLGVAFYRTGMLEEAAREFRRVLELRPGEVSAEFHLGLIALREGRLEDAIRAFRMCATRPGGVSSAYVNLAYALERAGRLDEARTALVDAALVRPDDPAVRLAQAVLALRGTWQPPPATSRPVRRTGNPTRGRRRGTTTPGSSPRCAATSIARRWFSRTASRRFRIRRHCTTTWPSCSNGADGTRRPPRRRSAPRSRTRPSRRSTRTWVTCCIAPAATTTRWRRMPARCAPTRTSAATCT